MFEQSVLFPSKEETLVRDFVTSAMLAGGPEEAFADSFLIAPS
jgi:hypothetical protein